MLGVNVLGIAIRDPFAKIDNPIDARIRKRVEVDPSGQVLIAGAQMQFDAIGHHVSNSAALQGDCPPSDAWKSNSASEGANCPSGGTAGAPESELMRAVRSGSAGDVVIFG